MITSQASNGHVKVNYDDGGRERIDMTKQTWKILPASFATSLQDSTAPELSSTVSSVLVAMEQYFGNKPFLKHQVQGFEQFPQVNAFRKVGETFLNTVRTVPKTQVPAG